MVIWMNKEDLRIIKTRNALREALVTLMKDKQFEEIKISDICDTALVNRSTFYAHYEDKYELLVDIIDSLKINLLDDLDKNKKILNTKEYYIELIKLLLNHINDKKDIYTKVLINNHNSILMDILEDAVMKDTTKKIRKKQIKTGDIPANIFIKYYLGGVANVCIEWLNNQNTYTENEIISYLEKLIPNNIGE